MASKLNTISPLDGRYTKDIQKLSDYFSEAALIKYRLMVEIEYLIMLSDEKHVLELEPLSISDKSKLRRIYKSFGDDEAKRVKAIETATNHDVKAIEYYINKGIDQNNPVILEHMGDIYHQLGISGKALIHYKKALEQDSNNRFIKEKINQINDLVCHTYNIAKIN